MNNTDTCCICDLPLILEWTDCNQIAMCCRCAAPYDVHDSKCECMVKEVARPVIREYWATTNKRAPNSMFFGGGPFTKDEYTSFSEFLDRVKAEGRMWETANV